MAAMKDGLGHHLSRKYWPLSVAYQVCSIFRAAVNAATAFSKLNSPKPQKTENWATWCTWPGSKLSGPGRSLQWAFEDRWDIAASACMLGIWIWDYDTKKKQWSCDPQKTIKKGLEKKMSIKIRESWGTTANDFSGALTSNIIEAVFHLVSVWSQGSTHLPLAITAGPPCCCRSSIEPSKRSNFPRLSTRTSTWALVKNP